MVPSLGPSAELLGHRAEEQFMARPHRQGQQTPDAAHSETGAGRGKSSPACRDKPAGTPSCRLPNGPPSSPQVNSGSSLVCEVNKTWIQMGVESWSFSCKEHRFPNMYTSTSYYTSWIQRHITDMQFVSRASSAFLSPVFLAGCILLVSLGSLGLL